MATSLQIHGPVEIPCSKEGTAKHIMKAHVDAFWHQPEVSSIKNKQGCYVFSLRWSKGFTPWYIGKTNKSMLSECFTAHKLGKFNAVLFKKKGTPVMFFVVPKDGKKVVPTKELKDIEKYLIQAGVMKNESLQNVQNAKNLPSWSIKGVVRSRRGKPNGTETGFRKMMGL